MAAHEKAEAQHWAGTVLDESFIVFLREHGYEVDAFLKPYAKKFKVPYKKAKFELPEEYVMCIITGTLNDEAFKNYGERIRNNFSNFNKSVDSEDVKEKIDNTINFLDSFRE